MVSVHDIESFSNALASAYRPQRIVLFGSYAHGNPRQDSDVDLLVTFVKATNKVQTVTDVITHLKPRFAVDLLIRTEKEIRDRLDEKDGFLTDILKHGRVLYEKAD